jgi:UDP-N-acetylmuramate: L-alanyl-gamma-D-glutamyl-meso-diaminopimelate ligase
MHLHILGIGGTFMSALAMLARAKGHQVTGSDANCYPPISDLLAEQVVEWTEGYDDSRMALQADCVIVGNAVKRGMKVLEDVMNAGKPYTSGPQWLAEHVLSDYRVIAVAGTHGKTSTTSMLAHILHHAGLNPGFLIGGVSSDLNVSSQLGSGDWFVIEADEYDSAFFDKRPKFIHYRPEIAILNNLEFDHADIYQDLEAIQQQFHYLLKTIPSHGTVLSPRDDDALNSVIKKGVYSNHQLLALNGDATWCAELLSDAGESFRILHKGEAVAEVHWSLIGRFNVENALAAFAASVHAGAKPEQIIKALESFKPVKRRLEVKGIRHDITVYDDFAHHPTAIAKTIDAVKSSGRYKRVLVVAEFASYTMKQGLHNMDLAQVFARADGAYFLKPDAFDIEAKASDWHSPHNILSDTQSIAEAVSKEALPGDAILVMSNRGFDNIHQKILAQIELRFT